MYVVLVTKAGERRARLLAGEGTTRLRVHATRFASQASAEKAAAEINEMNAGAWSARVPQ